MKTQEKKIEIPALLTRALEVTSDAVLISNQSGIIKYANSGFSKIFGYTSQEVTGKNLSTLMPEPYKSEHDGYLKRYLKTHIPHIIGIGREAKARKKNGEIFPIHISVGEFELDDHSFFLGILVDLTRQKETEATLLLSQERAILSQRFAGIGYWDWTIATGELYWSEQIAPMFGYEIGDLETSYENFLGAIHPDDRKPVEDAVNDCVTKGIPYEIEHRVIWPDKTVRWLLERGDVTRDQESNPVRMLGVVQDITSRKELEMQLMTAKEEAEAGAKSKATFLANMSHEIRTPLNSIIGFIELSLEDPVLPAHIKNHLKTANVSSKNLLHLLNDILDISKLEAGKLDVMTDFFYLPRFLMETIETMTIKAQEKALDLQLQIPNELHSCIYTDSGRLRQVLINLMGNAIKFTKKGRVSLDVSLQKNKLLFQVKDTGIGMSEKEVKKLFEPFTQADTSTARQYGGTGLGTTISKQLIELLQGKIWAESQPDKGSTLFFTIPYTAPECAENCDLNCDKHSLTDKGKTSSLTRAYSFLLAEDIIENAELARVRFQRQGCSIDIASNGQEAVNMYQKKMYDMIFMDIQMPVMDGLEATRQIRAIERKKGIHTPVIALTASVLQEERENCFKAGIDSIVTKPISFGDLFHLIEETMKNRKTQAPYLPPPKTGASKTEEISWPKGSVCIDIDEGLSNWQAAKAYANALISFSKKYKESTDQIENLLQKKDFAGAQKLTHALKGLTGNLAIGKLKELYSQANLLLKEEKDNDVFELLPEIKKELNAVLECISKIKIPEKEKKEHKRLQPLSPETIPELEGFISRLKRGEYNPDATARFIKKLENSCTPEELDYLQKSIEAFQFSNAVEILQKIKSQISIPEKTQ